MGTAVIESNLGNGLYRIKIQFNNAGIDSHIAYLDAKLIEVNANLLQIGVEKNTAKVKWDNDLLALNTFLSVNTPEQIMNDLAAVENLTKAVYESKGVYEVIVHKENIEKARKLNITLDKQSLTKYCPREISVNAWSVTYNTTLTGTVSVAEVDYVVERDMLTNQIRNDNGFWILADHE